MRPVCLLAFLMLFSGTIAACGAEDQAPTPQTESPAELDGDLAVGWVDTVLERIEADALSPPQASRILAYTGTAIYESTVDGMSNRQSLAGQLNDLDELPSRYVDSALDYPSVVHGTLRHLAPLLFKDEASRRHLESFARSGLEARRDAGVDAELVRRSTNRGVLIAESIASWMTRDGYYGRNDEDYTRPTSADSWTPLGAQQALEPFWSSLRPFVLSEANVCQPEPPPVYSSALNSDFYEQAMTVYETSQNLDAEQEEIAYFWADDPGASPTPPGHWAALAGQMIGDLELNFAEAAELYALVGITTADAVISCWDEKYRSNLMRPITYIRDHIDREWESLITTPPFPEYTSGHSNISASAAAVMTDLLGEVSFEDRTHEERGMAPRSFANFKEAADEAARSRLYGGIHYPVGNEQGLLQGSCVADRVLKRVETRID